MKELEWFAALISVFNVWLATNNKVWNWPVGILAVMLYAYIFYVGKLYAESVLQVFYLGMAIYGWANWDKQKREDSGGIASLSTIVFFILMLIWVTFSFGFGQALIHLSDSTNPYFDSAMATGGLLVTWMMARKFIEHWLCWIVLNSANSVLFFQRDMNVTAVLYIIFAILAVYGFYSWKKIQQA
jgi:nicotinamide mononucleotide transporter